MSHVANPRPITLQEAREAKIKNILEMSLDFSAMTRVFKKQSSTTILGRLEAFFAEAEGVTTKEEYDILHAAFCKWFVENISTAEKKLRNGRLKASCQCSYGHAAKVLDVAAKIYIYYSAQFSPEVTRYLIPMLHAALDTEMMRDLCFESPETLQGVDRVEYERLQALVTHRISGLGIHPVQYDDVMWRRIQRT